MSNDVKQFYNSEDGCVYFYDEHKLRYRKVCDIASFDELPFNVRQQIKAAKQEALHTINLPTE